MINYFPSKQAFDIVRKNYNRVGLPMENLIEIAATVEKQPVVPKYVLPDSPAVTARRNAIDYLVNLYERNIGDAKKGKALNKRRLMEYEILQTKLSKCITENKPVKIAWLDNMICIADKMFKAMLK